MTDVPPGSQRPVPLINPPPRRRPPQAETPSPKSAQGADATTQSSKSRIKRAQKPREAKQEEIKPRDHAVGYGKPPVEHQFKRGNPGGPGRTPGKKSPDTLLKAELSKKRVVRVGGRDRTVTNLELASTLLVSTALEKRDFKQLLALIGEARRVHPEPVEEPSEHRAVNPEMERTIMSQLLDQLQLGEPASNSADPLADGLFDPPAHDRRDGDASSSDDGWDADWETDRGE